MIKKVIGYWSLTFKWCVVIGIFLASPASVYAATLSLSPATGTFNRNCSFNLDIVLDTQGEATDGTDAYLSFDTAKFSANAITKGTIYAEYSGNNIDTTTGKVYISGLADATTPFNGKGTLATVNFTIKPTATAGLSQIKFDFDVNDKTKTSDSNVVLHSTDTALDVLSSVTDGNYTVGTGTTCLAQGATGTGSTSTASGAVSPSAGPDVLPPAGSGSLTATLTIVGGILTILGFLGLAIL